MEVLISVWGIVGIILTALVIGYFIGQYERKVLQQEEVDNSEEERGTSRRILLGKSIASPVDGKVHFFCEGGRKGAMIVPEQGRIYAPVSGKIVKLYPMGNAFILRADDQTEILIRVGRQQPDELCSMYFRARIVQNEIVNKGKLLLEFDRESLLAAGEEVAVTICLENGMAEGDVVVTEKEVVKVGEELLKTC